MSDHPQQFDDRGTQSFPVRHFVDRDQPFRQQPLNHRLVNLNDHHLNSEGLAFSVSAGAFGAGGRLLAFHPPDAGAVA